MKISQNWLLQYIDTQLSPDEIAISLTNCGLEVESLEKFETIKGGLKGVVVGEVITKEKHPDADRLSVTTVDIGTGTLLNIVCGGPNVAAGQKVLIATIGSTLYPITGEPIEIKKSKIRGAASEGMICAEDENKGLHPWDGVTEPNYHPEGPNFKGTRTKIENLDESAKYSWIKAPRWKGNAMEVGCLSRMVLGYVQPKQYPFIKETIDSVLHKLDLPVTALFSTLGRTAARGIETLYCAQLQSEQFDKLIANLKAGDTSTANIEKWEPSKWPKEAKGVGFTEAPRGSLGHWVKIKDTKIDNYQCVVPTTWNGSPRDPKGQIGAFEAALMDTPLAKADQPLEILRTLHSFDPCLACSTHVMSPEGQELSKVTVR